VAGVVTHTVTHEDAAVFVHEPARLRDVLLGAHALLVEEVDLVEAEGADRRHRHGADFAVPARIAERLGTGVGAIEAVGERRIPTVGLGQLQELTTHRGVHQEARDVAVQLLEQHVRRALHRVRRERTRADETTYDL
jgi:hypothetical protein